jgi:hypothetical protein
MFFAQDLNPRLIEWIEKLETFAPGRGGTSDGGWVWTELDLDYESRSIRMKRDYFSPRADVLRSGVLPLSEFAAISSVPGREMRSPGRTEFANFCDARDLALTIAEVIARPVSVCWVSDCWRVFEGKGHDRWGPPEQDEEDAALDTDIDRAQAQKHTNTVDADGRNLDQEGEVDDGDDYDYDDGGYDDSDQTMREIQCEADEYGWGMARSNSSGWFYG